MTTILLAYTFPDPTSPGGVKSTAVVYAHEGRTNHFREARELAESRGAITWEIIACNPKYAAPATLQDVLRALRRRVVARAWLQGDGPIPESAMSARATEEATVAPPSWGRPLAEEEA